MRASALIAGVFGVLAGFGAAVMFAPRGEERATSRDAAPASGAPPTWRECLARLDAIDARLAALAVPAAAPARVAVDETSGARLEERLAAIEAALANLATARDTATKRREESPRHEKEVAAVDRLFEAEYAKRLGRRDDHLGYTADRLYDRYGAPDYVTFDSNERITRWTYNDSSASRGVIFYLRDGLVVNEDPWTK